MESQRNLIDCGQPLPLGCISKSCPDMLSHFKSALISSDLIARSLLSDICEFQLGNELLSYKPPSAGSYLDDRPSTSECYLIIDGYVRLLCENLHLQRPISADLLGAGAIIGADHLFCKMPLPYRAIAAGPCHIIQISDQQLIAHLKQSPQLQRHLSQMAQQRERLIFFKRFTQQRIRPSHTLKHWLLPYLSEQTVGAGEYLSRSLPDKGYFWLRAGEILSQSNVAKFPAIGDSWGYPDPIPEDWIAQTDLIIYKLSLDAWEALDLLHAEVQAF